MAAGEMVTSDFASFHTLTLTLTLTSTPTLTLTRYDAGSDSSARTPPSGGMAAVVGAVAPPLGGSATGVAATLMLVREQGKMLRRVLAAQVELLP